MADVQLYDKDGSLIYPNSKDEIISSNAITGQNNVKSALTFLKQKIDEVNKTVR